MMKPLAASLVAGVLFVPAAAETAESYPGQSQMLKLGRSMAEKLAAQGGGAVAIAPAGDQNLKPTELSRFLEPDFVSSFKGSRSGLRIVSQSLFAAILRQHRLEATGLVVPDKLNQLGRFLSTRILVNVVVEPLPDSFVVRAVASDTRTAEFLAGDSVTLPRSPALVARLPPRERVVKAENRRPEAEKRVVDVRYRLFSCRRDARTVTCAFELTSLGGDQRVRLSRDTYAVDTRGQRHPAKRLNTGRQIGWKLLLKDIPVRIRVEFTGIPKDVKDFKTLRLRGKELDATFTGVRVIG